MALAAVMTAQDPDDAATRAILDHVARHPQAADTAAGVARWWVGDDGRYSVERITRLLDALVARRLLRAETLADGTVLYAGDRQPPGTSHRPH
jgi:hypothetical protein